MQARRRSPRLSTTRTPAKRRKRANRLKSVDQPWRFTVLDGPQAIAGYLDRLDAWYSDHKEEIDQQEYTKFLAKLEGSKTSWVNNASHVVVLGMVRQAGDTRAAEWEEVLLRQQC